MSSIAVSILNYNNATATCRCVRSLLAATPDSCDLSVWIADNGSKSEDRGLLARNLAGVPKVHLINNDRNLGFAVGHNINILSIFREHLPDYFWLLNNDCEVQSDTITALLTSARSKPAVALWGVTLLEADGETIQCAGGCAYSSWISSYRPLARGKSLSAIHSLQADSFDYVAGASLFMPAHTLTEGLSKARYHPKAIAEVRHRWLNESFFLYFEELDLARRLRKGLELAWCREALIIHNHRNSHAGKKRAVSFKSEYHATLSALKFTWLYHREKLWFMAPARFLAKLILNTVSLRFDLTSATIRAYGDFWQWMKHGEHPTREFG